MTQGVTDNHLISYINQEVLYQTPLIGVLSANDSFLELEAINNH
jgi:hypothetical protein